MTKEEFELMVEAIRSERENETDALIEYLKRELIGTRAWKTIYN